MTSVGMVDELTRIIMKVLLFLALGSILGAIDSITLKYTFCDFVT